MTTATKIITRTEVTLVMSGAEADALVDVLGKISGDPGKTRRKLVNNMYQALAAADVQGTHRGSPPPDMEGYIKFC